jgi:hypothetical protein
LKNDSATIAFQFIAKEIQWDQSRFDPYAIDQIYEDIEQLKVEFDDIEKLTAMINKREILLGVTQTEFKELRVI